MKSGLLRVLRVRQLLEELAGATLRTRTAELRRIEEGAEQHERQAMRTRTEALDQMQRGESADAWLGMADAEILAWTSQRLRAAARHAKPAVEAAHEQMLARRVEKRQAEALLTDAEQAEQQEALRREQHRLDDWFQTASGNVRRAE